MTIMVMMKQFHTTINTATAATSAACTALAAAAACVVEGTPRRVTDMAAAAAQSGSAHCRLATSRLQRPRSASACGLRAPDSSNYTAAGAASTASAGRLR
jgi:hypothetical protein